MMEQRDEPDYLMFAPEQEFMKYHERFTVTDKMVCLCLILMGV